MDSTVLSIGFICMTNGLFETLLDYRSFLEKVVDDYKDVSGLVYEAFLDVLRRADVPIVKYG